MFDSIFIIRNAPTNDLIFYGQLSDTPVEELETVLGQIIMKAQGQSAGTRKLIALKQGKFFYGIHEKFYFITALSKGTDKDIAEKVVRKLIDVFNSNFGEQLSNYSGDNSVFSSFSNDVQSIIMESTAKKQSAPTNPSLFNQNNNAVELNAQEPSQDAKMESFSEENPSQEENIESTNNEIDNVFGESEENDDSWEGEGESSSTEAEKSTDTSVFGKFAQSKMDVLPASQRKAVIQIDKSKDVTDSFNLNKPLITPLKRDAYPDGIPDYARDEVLFNESFEVQKNFECELVNYSVSDIKVNLNIALTHMYEIEIDFSEYPAQPKVILPDLLKEQLGKSIEEISYFLNNWDPKIPPHITEIVYEMEKILTRFKAEGKLSATQELPGYILPELEPLKDDIKWDPNHKPKMVPVPPPVIEEPVKPSSTTPKSTDGSAVKPIPIQGAPKQVDQKIDPKLLKQQQKAEEERKKAEEKKRKEEEKKAEKLKKELSKLKKNEEKEKKFHDKLEANEKEEDE